MPNEPDPNRMRTRASNSNAHPGARAADALRVYRPKEVIQREKDEKKARKEAKEEQRLTVEANKKAGKKYISQLEAEVAAEAADDKYPRHHIMTKRK